MNYTMTQTCAKNSPNSPTKTSKMYWPKHELKSGGMKMKNTRFRWVYPSKPIENLLIIWTKITQIIHTKENCERNYDSYSNGNHCMEDRHNMRDSRKPYEWRDQAQERPKQPEYNLNIDLAKLVGVLKGMGEIVKWPQKMKSPLSVQDTRKWCEFHQDYSEWTDECRALWLEVFELLKQGHLKDQLTKCSRVTRDKSSYEKKMILHLYSLGKTK